MATPTYMVAIPIDPSSRQWWGKNKMKVLHVASCCSLKQINKGMIKVFDTPYIGISNQVYNQNDMVTLVQFKCI